MCDRGLLSLHAIHEYRELEEQAHVSPGQPLNRSFRGFERRQDCISSGSSAGLRPARCGIRDANCGTTSGAKTLAAGRRQDSRAGARRFFYFRKGLLNGATRCFAFSAPSEPRSTQSLA